MKKKVANKKDNKILREIGNLTLTTSKGFEGVNRRLDEHDKGFESIHKRLGEHDKGFESVHKEIEDLASITGKGFEGVYKKFDEVDKRFDKVDKRFDEVDMKFELVADELGRLNDEVKDLKGITMSLVQSDAAQDKENRKIIFRLDHLENQVVAKR